MPDFKIVTAFFLVLHCSLGNLQADTIEVLSTARYVRGTVNSVVENDSTFATGLFSGSAIEESLTSDSHAHAFQDSTIDDSNGDHLVISGSGRAEALTRALGDRSVAESYLTANFLVKSAASYSLDTQLTGRVSLQNLSTGVYLLNRDATTSSGPLLVSTNGELVSGDTYSFTLLAFAEANGATGTGFDFDSTNWLSQTLFEVKAIPDPDPNAIPTPTAAFMGLMMLGGMAMKRQRRMA